MMEVKSQFYTEVPSEDLSFESNEEYLLNQYEEEMNTDYINEESILNNEFLSDEQRYLNFLIANEPVNNLHDKD